MATISAPDQQIYTTRSLAEMFNVCERTIEHWRKRGLKSLKINRVRRYLKRDVDEFVSRHLESTD